MAEILSCKMTKHKKTLEKETKRRYNKKVAKGLFMKEIRRVFLGEEELVFSFEAKRVKNYNLRVHADGSVFVSAPARASQKDVAHFVLTHADFIRRAQKRQATRSQAKTPICDGGTVFYRGERYMLRVSEGKGEITFSNAEMCLPLPKGALLEKTFQTKIFRLFYPVLLDACRERERSLSLYGIPFAKEIKLRHMKSMWGNCRHVSGVLTFSTMLSAVSPALLDYVICHEYAHLVHPDHSAAFYALLARICPDYKEKRAALKKIQYERGFC